MASGGYAGGDAPHAHAALLREKTGKFGLMGAGLISDPMAAIKMHQAHAESQAKDEERERQGGDESGAGSSNGVAVSSSSSVVPCNPGDLPRSTVVEILKETAAVQAEIQQKISVLARKLAKEKDKKKRKNFGFIEAHERIVELNLPKEPVERHGLSEHFFQAQVQRFEEDNEVMMYAEQMLRPAGKGDPTKSGGITREKIIDIHRYMVDEMQRILKQFLQLEQEQRRSFSGKACETTAELLVSVAVERQFSIHCEDVEQAVLIHERDLQESREFTACTEQLAGMMQHLIGAAQPRVTKEQFITILENMAVSTKKAKAFAKKLAEDYRQKQCNIVEAYARFEAFAEEATTTAEAESVEVGVPDLNPTEMRVFYCEYADDPRAQAAWINSNAEGNTLMQYLMSGLQDLSILPQTPTPESKAKKLKASEITEMQELMVDELKRLVEAMAHAQHDGVEKPWNPELAVHMIQALASAAVERRYGVAAEDMTVAGFQQKGVLQQNERFVRATEKQKQIMCQIPKLCGGEAGQCVVQ